MRTDALGALSLRLLLFVWICVAASAEPTAVRVADAPCQKCHASIFANYLKTPMANASGAASDQFHPTTFIHNRSQAEYTIKLHDGDAILAYRSLRDPSLHGTARLTAFLGSGHLGTTYLYSTGNYLFESPVAWYAASDRYDMKPGLAQMDRIPPPLAMQSGCLRCHMSAVQPSDPGTMNRYSHEPFQHGGITCEACHGDSAAHVRAGGKGVIVNPAHLTAELRDSVCISCHLEGDVTIKRASRSALDYKPGEPISKYLTFYVRNGSDLTRRGVSEVEQLAQSTCKRTSGDKMSCMSCHDPHYTPAPAEKASFYRSKCLACHSQPAFAQTHHPENQDCTSCHMPRAGAANILHVAWTDHRILRTPKAESALRSSTDTPGRLDPIFSPGATPRDQAMADYQALLEGDRTLEASAWRELLALKDHLAADKEALDALGNLAAERGDTHLAEQVFQQALQLDPLDLTAKSNLGILLARQGKLTESVDLLKTAFDRNEDIPGLAMNLARVLCMSGDGNAARDTLARALTYAPTAVELEKLRSQLTQCSGVSPK